MNVLFYYVYIDKQWSTDFINIVSKGGERGEVGSTPRAPGASYS